MEKENRGNIQTRTVWRERRPQQRLWRERFPQLLFADLPRSVSGLNSAVLLSFQDYDDGYGTAYDEQGYESYDNSYNNQGQK